MSYYTSESFNYYTEGSYAELSCFLTKAVKEIKPVKVYNNFKENRLQLMKDQKDKTGIYCLVNLINGNTYIGSSISLSGRMRNYLNNAFFFTKK